MTSTINPHPEQALRFHYNALHMAIQAVSAAVSTAVVTTAGLLNDHAPINQLPLDIVTDIWLLSLLDAGRPNFEAGVYYKQLKTLSRVCTTWRNWTEVEPRLWAYVHTMDPWPTVRRALRKSGEMPLTVILNETLNQVYSEGAWSRGHTDCLHEFAQHVNRWKHVSIGLNNGSPLRGVLQSSETSVPLREELIIRSDNRIDVRWLFGAGAPRLAFARSVPA